MEIINLSAMIVLGEGGLLDPNPGLSVWTLIVFAIVSVILSTQVWGPLSKMIDEREKSIQDAVNQASEGRAQIEKMLADQQTAIAEAKREAADMVRRSQADVEKAKESMMAQAKTESEALLVQARAQIIEEKTKALAEVRSVAVELAMQAASKLVQQELTSATHKKLAEEYVKGLAQDASKKQSLQ